MSIGEILGTGFFENAYIVLLFFIPYLLVTKGLLLFVFTAVLMYGCWRIIEKRRRSYIDPSNKSILITGCDTGFGNEVAKRLSSLGFRVFAGCLSKSSQGALELAERSITVLQMDVTNDKEISECFEQVKEQCENKGLYGLINNAGIIAAGAVEVFPIEQYQRILDVNLLGTIRTTKAFLPLIRKCKGRIVNLSSIQGVTYFPDRSPYCISKHAVEKFTDTLRLELRKFDIDVSLIQPSNFSGGTGILSGDSMKNVRVVANNMWAGVNEEVKNAYGQTHAEDVISGLEAAHSFSCKDITPVINAIVESVHTEVPKIRYLISDTQKLYDINTILVRVFPYLPDWLKDRIISLMVGSGSQ